ncbi:cell wall protein [Penicillium cataractarum]|uniref:Cell wall protein n=1 Tax=Penicillium cataractarum TaxID=2100454 RepID=A0A9W9SHR4_9EURO|nr:cell wall protein [Penicillium cataractarum]KAJ5377479.1 cell wall protein [Penicillium cataractarum]
MKLVLAWLVAALVSPISAHALYNLTSEFPDDCAIFCTATEYVHGPCDVDSVACWCQTPDFVSDVGCCIAYACDKDLKSVKTTFKNWCSAASVEGPTDDTTKCGYPYGTGTLSGSSQAKFGSIPGKVIGGAVVACLAGLILSLALVFHCFHLSKKQKQQQVSPPTQRIPTPNPPYSEPRQIPRLNRSTEGSQAPM